MENSRENTPSRRTQILDAALACFLDKGYLQTTIAQIRTKSGASTGSIYHLFSGKPAIAHALVAEAIQDWQQQSGLKDGSIKKAVKSSINNLLSLGNDNWPLFQFIEEMRVQANNEPDLASLKDLFETEQNASKQLYRDAATEGKVRDIPWPLAHSLMLGPVYTYLRVQGSAVGERKIALAKKHLSAAAWQAVKAKPAKPAK